MTILLIDPDPEYDEQDDRQNDLAKYGTFLSKITICRHNTEFIDCKNTFF